MAWHSYNKAPGKTGMGKLLSGLGGLAATMLATAEVANTAQLSYKKGDYGSTCIPLDRDIKNSHANDFMAVLTAMGGNNQASSAVAVIVSKIDGKNISSILLGDKTPDYKLDELGRMIYQKSESDEMKGFNF